MSETESPSYLEELESRAYMALKQSSKERNAKPHIDSPVKVEEHVPKEVKNQPSEQPKVTSEKLPMAKPSRKRRKTQSKAKTHSKVDGHIERTLRKVVNEQSKKTKADLKMLEKVMKKHESKIQSMIGSNLSRSISLHEEVKGLINGQSEDLKKSCEDIVVNNNQEETQKLTDWFYNEFMNALDKKSGEYETLKTSSEAQANRMVEEIDGKAKRIEVLDQKIVDIAKYVPKKARSKVFTELGLEYLESVMVQAAEKKPAKQGFMAKLSSMFKSKPKQPTQPSVVAKNKKKLEEQKRTRKKQLEDEIIAE